MTGTSPKVKERTNVVANAKHDTQEQVQRRALAEEAMLEQTRIPTM